MAIFKGAGVAIVTPMFEDGSVNYDKLKEILEEQIASETDAIIICGTTGESATMSEKEHSEVIKFAVDTVAKRIPVIAGVSKNNTSAGITEADVYSSMGADGLLVITPYCSKSTEDGLLEHFRMIKAVSGLPIIAYNVPNRTGYNLSSKLVSILAKEGTIQGIKQANKDIQQSIDILYECAGKCSIYSGEDGLSVPLRSIGAVGSISVLALVMPEVADALFDLPLSRAGKLQVEINELVKLLFCEVNPVPVKYLLSELKKCENILRLPLSPLSKDNQSKLKKQATKLLDL